METNPPLSRFLQEPDPPPGDAKRPESSSCERPKTKRGGQRKRTAEAVSCELKELLSAHRVNACVFLTLTFPDLVKCLREANRRWHSLASNAFKERYLLAVLVVERCKSGLVHYHVIALLRSGADVRSGFDFEAFKAARTATGSAKVALTRRYGASASPALREEWAWWKQNAPSFGFGRVECAPIEKPEGAARYVAKYITKATETRLPEDKGARLVRFIGYTKQGEGTSRVRLSTGWAWNTKGARVQRAKFAWAARRMGLVDEDEAKEVLGRHWAYTLGKVGEEAPIGAIPKELREFELLSRIAKLNAKDALLAEVPPSPLARDYPLKLQTSHPLLK